MRSLAAGRPSSMPYCCREADRAHSSGPLCCDDIHSPLHSDSHQYTVHLMELYTIMIEKKMRYELGIISDKEKLSLTFIDRINDVILTTIEPYDIQGLLLYI